MKKFIVFLIIVLLVAAALAKDELAEIYSEKVLSDILGVKVDIGRMTVGFPRTYVKLEDIVVYNPNGYEDKVMGKVTELYVDYEARQLLHREVYLTELKFYLKELNVVKNKEGLVNFTQIKPIKNKQPGEDLEDAHSFFIPRVHIEKMHLKAGQVNYKDYSRRVKPAVHTFNVGVDSVYYDIDDPYTLIRLIISQTIHNTMVSHIIQIPMNEVSDIINNSASTVTTVIKDEGPIRSAFDTIKDGLFRGGWFSLSEERPDGAYST